jgi:HSP20 family protein
LEEIKMTLVKFRRPYHVPVNQFFENNWNDVFSNALNQQEENASCDCGPSANILESDEKFIIELSVPGYAKDEISVKVENSVLMISPETGEEVKEDNIRFVRREFSKSGFKRNFRLSRWIDGEGISASFKNGILFIELPKKAEARAKPSREIEIN